MVNCRQVIKQISGYLDGELDEDLRHSIEAHIHRCAHCTVVVDTTKKTIELYCDGKIFPLPDDVRHRLHTTLRRRWEEKRRGK